MQMKPVIAGLFISIFAVSAAVAKTDNKAAAYPGEQGDQVQTEVERVEGQVRAAAERAVEVRGPPQGKSREHTVLRIPGLPGEVHRFALDHARAPGRVQNGHLRRTVASATERRADRRGVLGVVAESVDRLDDLAVKLQHVRPLFIDSANSFDPYALGRTCKNPKDVLNNILISRPFTIHQLKSLVFGLEELVPAHRVVIVSSIDALYREGSRPREAPFVLTQTLSQLRHVTVKHGLLTFAGYSEVVPFELIAPYVDCAYTV